MSRQIAQLAFAFAASIPTRSSPLATLERIPKQPGLTTENPIGGGSYNWQTPTSAQLGKETF